MLNYLRDDIKLNIKSNLELPIPFNEKEEYIEINYYDKIEVITPKGRKLSFEEVVLLYLYLINSSSREQIGVVIPKNIPTTLDNQLTYLIIKRKDSPEFSEIFFLVHNNQIIFPFFSREENRVFNVLKLAELIKRREVDIDKFIETIYS